MDMLMDEYLKYLQDEKHVSDNTFSSYRRDLKKLIRYLREHGIQEGRNVDSNIIQGYLDNLKESNYAISSITRNFIAVRSFFRYLYDKGYISENPSEWARPPKGKSNPNTVLSKEEMAALLKQPTGMSFKGLRDRAMLLLLYDTKISILDLVHLKVGELDFQNDRIVCKNRDKGRMFPFHEETKKALKEHINYSELGEEDWLFPNRYGNPMSRQGFWKIVKNYAKESGIEKEISLYSIKQGEI
jgi:integrase/recombinase XerD